MRDGMMPLSNIFTVTAAAFPDSVSEERARLVLLNLRNDRRTQTPRLFPQAST
jgi:hypothetical protein